MKRKLIIGLIGCMGLTFTSCGDFLNLEPLNEIILENFWNEKSDVENIVAGCYASLQSQEVVERMMAWGEFRSDNIIGGTNISGNESLENVFKENIKSDNTFTNWDPFYSIINTCNTVLHYAPGVAEKDPTFTKSELDATIAEVSTIRALCYFYLIRAFRDVPYVTEPFIDDTQEMALPATPFYDVLDSLITDLEAVKPYAVKKYPSNKLDYQTGRLTQDAIHALLCDLHLWKQNYEAAVRYADLVIDAKTADYQKVLDKLAGNASVEDQMIGGYPLISDRLSSYYGNAYNIIFGTGNSRESIFELNYSSEKTMPSNGAVSYYYGNEETYPGIVKPAEFITTDMTLDRPNVYAHKYDSRYYENMQSTGTTYGINKYASNSSTVNASASTPDAAYGSMYAKDNCYANWIVYRLTDVMLMKAEAMVQLIDENDTTENAAAVRDSLLRGAFEIVSVVNSRSSFASTEGGISYGDFSSKTQMTNLVLDERNRELMFEGKRWFDLVRRAEREGNTSYLIAQVTRKGSDNASVVQSKLSRMDGLYWPYNKEELQVNPNLKQNPAYPNEDDGSYENTMTK
ncbi:MAG: RagB/SusD family nutrient uptake outer membrane protein [Bacteroidaceae bacterium]|nr:RagB/SusD family nutrient uptake outer membrane protein [Bacteroidaceae bacterium]